MNPTALRAREPKKDGARSSVASSSLPRSQWERQRLQRKANATQKLNLIWPNSLSLPPAN